MTFLGPSGSGKSTTLYILAGFENSDKRRHSRLTARPCWKRPSHKRNIGMVFQRYTLFPHLTVGENIAFPLKVRRKSQGRGRHQGEGDADVSLDLKDTRTASPYRCRAASSSAWPSRRALAYDPPVLLMDEPLSALDKKLREEIQHEIRRIHQQTEVTILYVTHDQEEALRLSDRIAVFSKGVIDQIGTGPQLYANPRYAFCR